MCWALQDLREEEKALATSRVQGLPTEHVSGEPQDGLPASFALGMNQHSPMETTV